MKSSFFYTLFIIFCFAPSLFLSAQEAATWQVTFDKPLEWSTISETGMLLVCTKDSLYGVDPDRQKIAWQRAEMGNIMEEQLDQIPGTPFIIVNNLGDYVGDKLIKMMASGPKKGRFALMNSFTGEFIFDSQALGWDKIEGTQLMLESGAFFVMGSKDKARILAKVSIFENGLKWVQPVPIATKRFTFKDVSFYAPSIDPEGHYIFSYADNLFRLHSEDGHIMWQQPYASITNLSFVDDDPSVFYATAGLDNKLNRFELATGNPLWFDVLPGTLGNLFKNKEKREAATIKATGHVAEHATNDANQKIIGFSDYRVLEGEEFFVVGKKGFNYYHKETGKPRWENPYLFKFLEGNVLRVIPFPNAYVVLLELNNQKRFQLCDLNGQPIWDKPVPIVGYRLDVYALTEHGLFYMSDSQIGILDVETGEARMRRNFALDVEKGYLPYIDLERGKALIYQKNSMYEVDFASASTTEIINKIKFKGDGKDFPSVLEPVEGGYFLANQQNYLKINYDGRIAYQGYHRRPGTPMWLRRASAGALKVVTAVAISVLSYQLQNASIEAYYNGNMSRATASDMVQTYSVRNPNNPLFVTGGAMFIAFDRIAERRNATLSLQDEMLLLSRLETGDVGLLRIEKITGEETGSLIIRDKSPEYAVDAVASLLYYFPNRKRIEVFEME